jgi:hypothetical protein
MISLLKMKRAGLFLLLISMTGLAFAQSVDKVVKQKQVRKILETLSGDDMKGREAFTPGIEKAADYISKQFRKIGLKQMEGVSNYRQSFQMMKPTPIDASAKVGDENIDGKRIIAISGSANLHVTDASGYKKAYIKKGVPFGSEATKLAGSKEPTVVFIDTSFARRFRSLRMLAQFVSISHPDIIFVLTSNDAASFTIDVTQKIDTVTGHNIVGVLPGRRKKDEQVIFSAHYDHLGITKAVDGDSVYNGANDDASGVTAMIMAAKYFKKKKNNERTLAFVAFTAEEEGGLGSQQFSKSMNAEKVVAMFNLEMIGTDSKWGKNSAYITGFNETNMGTILQSNLKGTAFTFYPDPYTEQNLFYRSDNATLARLGVPAHTISTSKMDAEPNYHKLSDEVKTLDVANMTEIVKSIILSATSIVSGKDTPTRVKPGNLR